ncbi:hypothetical protein DFR30_2166 [Thiogranum longum]|uniref:Uncharacterized protein n=1 Tax=Thiogranum longum TaxID=1537524 RepID=A0A4R1HDT3_9GAMM|nr:hypothetical protein [Thiogranum longum]TCK18881.1 hypothetical protein DFR30_2166 [Thiogranum longum]
MIAKNKDLSLFGSMLRTLRITSAVAKYISILSVAFILFYASLIWSFKTSPIGLTSTDVLVFFVVNLISVSVLGISTWLGFSRKGCKYLERLFHDDAEDIKILRVIKVLFASGALAFSIYVIIFVLLLFVGGSNAVLILFNGKVTGAVFFLLAILLLPFVRKRLK